MCSSFFKKFIQYHGFSILCGLGILILCTIQIPPEDNLPLFPNFDKVVHFFMYFILSLLVILETIKTKALKGKSILRTFVAAILVSFLFGGAIEIIQGSMTDYRSADILDLFCDMGGSVAACLLIGSVRHAFR